MLDKRLQKIADLVSGKGIAVDVGTDHAYLAAELVKSGKCRKVIASDVKEGPLASARHTVESCGVTENVELVLSDGLDKIPLNGVTDVVIAGMGGETIADIIANVRSCEDVNSIRWILQPMTKPEILRKSLYEFQMQITEEFAVEESEKLYVVMVAEYNPDFRYLTQFDALYGFFCDDDPAAIKYRSREAERLEKVSVSLKNGGRTADAIHFKSLAYKMKNGCDSVKIADIYDYLDNLYPFNLQEKWDNSGLLVENRSGEADTVVLSLDITDGVCSEASCKWADLVISHHPVIFDPLRRLTKNNPVYRLVENDIAAICAHTNLDIAPGGTNGVILAKLQERFPITRAPEPFEELGNGNNLGWIVEFDEPLCASEFAAKLKDIFGCEFVRFNANSGEMKVDRVAFCSGSGGSMLELAAEKKCDALITGDVKHDVWISAINGAYNYYVNIFDCGHFYTENIVLHELRRVLEEKFPQLDIEIAERSADPCQYV